MASLGLLNIPASLRVDGLVCDTRKPFFQTHFEDIYNGRWKGKSVFVKRVRKLEEYGYEDVIKELIDSGVKFKSLDYQRLLPLCGILSDNQFYYIITLGAEYKTMSELVGAADNRRNIEALPMLRQVVDGLKYLHLQGIVHRNLVLDNVLVYDNGRNVKLGFERAMSLQAYARTECRFECRAAPEVHMDPTRFTFQSDIYALGFLIYEAHAPLPKFPRIEPVLENLRPKERPTSNCYGPTPISLTLWSIIQECWQDAGRRPLASDILLRLD